MTTIPLGEAEHRSSALVEAAERTHEVISLSPHGREVAVPMAKEDLDSLHETLFWLSESGVREDVAAARAEVERGETSSGAELRTGFGLGG